MDSLPDYCRAVSDIWRARVPVVCFHVVEHHYPDRVLRQFGGYQGIPDPPADMRALHEIDLRGRSEWNWEAEHAMWIALWGERRVRIVAIHHLPETTSDDYFPWYQTVTRRWIGRTGAMIRYMADFIHQMPHIPPEDTADALHDAIRVVDDMMGLNINDPAPAPAQEPRPRRDRRGRARRGARGRGQQGPPIIRDEPSPPPPHHEQTGPSFVHQEEPGPSSSHTPHKRGPLPSDDMGEGLTQVDPDPVSFQRGSDTGGDDDATLTQADPSMEYPQQDVRRASPFVRVFRRRRRGD